MLNRQMQVSQGSLAKTDEIERLFIEVVFAEQLTQDNEVFHDFNHVPKRTAHNH